jgi:hypothetical protein
MKRINTRLAELIPPRAEKEKNRQNEVKGINAGEKLKKRVR